MKVAVINYCGTVGKTTIAAHLLAPRMEQARIYAVETINESAGDLGLEHLGHAAPVGQLGERIDPRQAVQGVRALAHLGLELGGVRPDRARHRAEVLGETADLTARLRQRRGAEVAVAVDARVRHDL